MGTSYSAHHIICQAWDHPHAYGDKTVSVCASVRLSGSSPRVWGQDPTKSGSATITGIIPTRMGTSDLISPIPTRKGDHPHAYGDKTTLSPSFAITLGSSPRVWGQAIKLLTLSDIAGIIPTRMGTRVL